jgi:outer membrane protein OmpA-like peptidoglycan-associated protein
MLPINKIIQKSAICLMMVVLTFTTAQGQVKPPVWWYGVSGAANFNFYDGTTQRLNNSLIVPAAFHKGNGVRPYGSVFLEYRPAGAWGAMLNAGYDSRAAKFKDVIAPCDCPASLKTNTDYITIEPSLRWAASNFYLFAGPTIAFNTKKDFEYTQLKQPNTNAELSNMRKTLIGGQIGAGYEIPLSSANSTSKVNLSPFVSFHPYFGRAPRNIESWQITTLRVGLALKFGKGSKVIKEVVAAPVRDFAFSVRAPKTVPLKRQVSETLPLRNSVFFDEGSTQVPARYVMLDKSQASSFKETQLQTEQSAGQDGRSARQLNIYHNIMNIMGDRLRQNPGAAITLSGASGKGPQEGKVIAEAVKQYIVNVFGINGSRIATEGRTKPVIPSEQVGGTKELVLLRAGDRRVDITSASPELLSEVGGGIMKPVQITATQVDPLDSHVILRLDSAKQLLKSWSVDVTNAAGVAQHYGPFTRDQESIPGALILANNTEGDYKVVMTGETKKGVAIRKESTVHLMRQSEALSTGLRYSILFDFNKANTIASYEKFLSDVVSASVTDGSAVIIHGHTDIIGEEDYNMKLSQERAREVQGILERALAKAGKNNVKFETLGFGEDLNRAPFENTVPEERFYNRTVIIDIIPVK